MKKKYIYLLGISLLVQSCFSIKPQVSKTGANIWEEFYVSPKETQYFIKPLTFENKEEAIRIDFTFRSHSDSVTVNYSISSKQKPVVPKAIAIANDAQTVWLRSNLTLNTSVNRSSSSLRRTSKIALSEIKALLGASNWSVNTENGKISKFDATSATFKKISILRERLLPQLANDDR